MSRSAWARYGAGLLVLALVTVAAAVWLMNTNLHAYEEWINFDPQGADQQWEDLQTSAALAYTSGHSVGHLCAFLSGVLLAGLTGGRSRRLNLTVAGLGGVVLAVASLIVALPLAHARLGTLWMVSELADEGFDVHRRLLDDSAVLAFLAGSVLAFPLWAAAGLGAGLFRRPLAATVAGLAWYPVSLAGGCGTAGMLGLVVPFYGNLGAVLLVIGWPVTVVVLLLVLGLWATALCIKGFAAAILRERTTSESRQRQRDPGQAP